MIHVAFIILSAICFMLMRRTEDEKRDSTFGLCIVGGVISAVMAIGYAGGMIV